MTIPPDGGLLIYTDGLPQGRRRDDRRRFVPGFVDLESRVADVPQADACGSFSRQRRSSRRIASGVARRQRRQSGSRVRIAAIVSDIVSPSNARAPVSISYSTTPERPDVGALVHRPAPRLLGAHVGGRPQNHARACRHASASATAIASAPRASPDRSAFASPKSSTFTVPSGADLDVRGFQIAMDDALARARLRALRRSASRSAAPRRTASRPCAMRSASVGALDQLHDQRVHAARFLEAVDRARCWDG